MVTPQGQKLSHELGTLPDFTREPASSDRSSVSFIILFNKLVSVSGPWSSVSLSSKVIEPKEGAVGTSDL